jgi:translocation and assembly module TamB
VPLAEPRRGEGRLSIDPLRLVVAGQAWESRGPVELRWAQGGFSLADVRIASNDGLVTASGTVAPDGRLDAGASARLPLAQFAGLVPAIRELGGTLDLSVRAAGTLDAPTFAGEGAVVQGSLLLRDRPEALRDVEARFTMAKEGVHLREATASIGGGRVQASGDAALRGWRLGGYRVRLNAKQVALALVDGLSSVWDADLELSGITGQAQLEGRARLLRGVYTRDLSIVSLALAPGREAADTGPPLRLRVRVDLDDNLVVKNRTADLRAGGVLSVEGTASHPVIFGYVRSRDGRVVFRGRDWTVTNAAVRFADPRRVDPFLDVIATSRIGEYDVTMHITGPASDLAVRLSSTPRLSQNDLLSLVAFGATGADLKESPATVLLGEAGKLLARNVFGIEPSVTGLRVSTGSSADTTTEVRGGFPGEDRSTTTGPARSTPDGRGERVRVEYQLFAPLFLAGEYDRDSGYGADVVLRFRFR